MKNLDLREFAEIVLESIRRQVLNCITLKLYCRDPPAVTSITLRKIFQLNEYKVRKFWKICKRLCCKEIKIFSLNDVEYYLKFVYRKGSIFYIKPDVFLDHLDCKSMNTSACREITNINLLYLYIKGRIEGDEININVIYVLKKLAEEDPKLLNELFNRISAFINHCTFTHLIILAKYVLYVVNRYSHILKAFLGYIPREWDELVMLSPPLKKATTTIYVQYT